MLTYASQLLLTGGMPVPGASLVREGSTSSSPRLRGIKQGVFTALLGILLFPLLGLLLVFALGNRPWPAGVVLFLLVGAGLLRTAYALMFESKAPFLAEEATGDHLPGKVGQQELPPQRTRPVGEYTSPQPGHWRDTNDLEPTSVVEGTTKLLEKESDPPT